MTLHCCRTSVVSCFSAVAVATVILANFQYHSCYLNQKIPSLPTCLFFFLMIFWFSLFLHQKLLGFLLWCKTCDVTSISFLAIDPASRIIVGQPWHFPTHLLLSASLAFRSLFSIWSLFMHQSTLNLVSVHASQPMSFGFWLFVSIACKSLFYLFFIVSFMLYCS